MSPHGEGSYFIFWRLSEQKKGHGHNDHSRYKTVDGQMVFSVLLSRGQQFVQGDEDHDSRHRGKENAEDRIIEEGGDQAKADKGSYGF